MEDLFTSLIIYVNEVRDTAILIVSEAYLTVDMPEGKFNILKIEGEFVYIMCKVNPEHKKNARV